MIIKILHFLFVAMQIYYFSHSRILFCFLCKAESNKTFSFNRKYAKIDSVTSVNSPVQDVAFAPNLGRSVNLLAIASKDVTIVQFKSQG